VDYFDVQLTIIQLSHHWKFFWLSTNKIWCFDHSQCKSFV